MSDNNNNQENQQLKSGVSTTQESKEDHSKPSVRSLAKLFENRSKNQSASTSTSRTRVNLAEEKTNSTPKPRSDEHFDKKALLPVTQSTPSPIRQRGEPGSSSVSKLVLQFNQLKSKTKGSVKVNVVETRQNPSPSSNLKPLADGKTVNKAEKSERSKPKVEQSKVSMVEKGQNPSPSSLADGKTVNKAEESGKSKPKVVEQTAPSLAPDQLTPSESPQVLPKQLSFIQRRVMKYENLFCSSPITDRGVDQNQNQSGNLAYKQKLPSKTKENENIVQSNVNRNEKKGTSASMTNLEGHGDKTKVNQTEKCGKSVLKTGNGLEASPQTEKKEEISTPNVKQTVPSLTLAQLTAEESPQVPSSSESNLVIQFEARFPGTSSVVAEAVNQNQSGNQAPKEKSKSKKDNIVKSIMDKRQGPMTAFNDLKDNFDITAANKPKQSEKSTPNVGQSASSEDLRVNQTSPKCLLLPEAEVEVGLVEELAEEAEVVPEVEEIVAGSVEEGTGLGFPLRDLNQPTTSIKVIEVEEKDKVSVASTTTDTSISHLEESKTRSENVSDGTSEESSLYREENRSWWNACMADLKRIILRNMDYLKNLGIIMGGFAVLGGIAVLALFKIFKSLAIDQLTPSDLPQQSSFVQSLLMRYPICTKEVNQSDHVFGLPQQSSFVQSLLMRYPICAKEVNQSDHVFGRLTSNRNAITTNSIVDEKNILIYTIVVFFIIVMIHSMTYFDTSRSKEGLATTPQPQNNQGINPADNPADNPSGGIETASLCELSSDLSLASEHKEQQASETEEETEVFLDVKTEVVLEVAEIPDEKKDDDEEGEGLASLRDSEQNNDVESKLNIITHQKNLLPRNRPQLAITNGFPTSQNDLIGQQQLLTEVTEVPEAREVQPAPPTTNKNIFTHTEYEKKEGEGLASLRDSEQNNDVETEVVAELPDEKQQSIEISEPLPDINSDEDSPSNPIDERESNRNEESNPNDQLTSIGLDLNDSLPDIKVCENESTAVNPATYKFKTVPVLFTIANIPIHQTDLDKLLPTKWLNDTIVEAYLNLLVAAYDDDELFIVSPLDFTAYRSSLINKTTPKYQSRFPTKDIKTILIPVQFENHWTLTTIKLRNSKVYYYDSMTSTAIQNCFRTKKAVWQFILELSRVWSGKEFSKPQKEIYEDVKSAPQQTRSEDCGIFICLSAYHSLTNTWPSIPDQKIKGSYSLANINAMRFKMLKELNAKTLLSPTWIQKR